MNTLSHPFLVVPLILVLSTITAPVFAGNQRFALDPNHTEVHISWSHEGFSNPGATFVVAKGTLLWNEKDPAQSSVRVTIPVASVDTRVPALNARLRSDVFGAEKYPAATFRSSNILRRGQPDHYLVFGKLTVHGITRSVRLRATINNAGARSVSGTRAIGFDAETVIWRSDFGLGGDTTRAGDEIRIHITTEALEPQALEKEEAALRRQSGPQPYPGSMAVATHR